MRKQDVMVQHLHANEIDDKLPTEREKRELPQGWAMVTIGNVMETIYRYPSYYNIDYVADGVPEIRGELLISNGEIERSRNKLRFISRETDERFPRTRLLAGDIVMSVRGTMGKVGLVPKELEGANITANLIRLSPKRSLVCSDFVRWACLADDFTARLDTVSPQTTIKTITVSALKSIELPLPPLPEQYAISQVLRTVQEAIQTRRDELELEREYKIALSEYLFTHGTCGETTKQTEIGEIPKSWIISTLGDIATLQRGFDITRNEQRPGKIPVVSSSGILSYHDTAKVKGPGVIIGRKGSLGTVFYVEDDYWPHDTTLWVKDFHGNDPKFIYYFLKSLNFKQFDVGASNPTLNRNHIHIIRAGLPELNEQCQIAEVLTACDTKISFLEQESIILDELFRALLEELITGRLSTLPLIEERENS